VTTVTRSVLVPYSAAEMYALVNDVGSYPQFLPWCRSARIVTGDEDMVKARIELALGGVHKTFTTCNRLQKNKMIEVHLLEGPFRHLEGYWSFDALAENSCKVALDMEFEFSNWLLHRALGHVFGQIVNTLVDAFRHRAEQVHGRR
jgi:ribosome-associated toxin RatA of RatAB toxin-antitoxin module